MSDAVNHPSHYTSHRSGVECIEVVQHMTFCVGNAVKYLWRAGLKVALYEDEKVVDEFSEQHARRVAKLQDLKKARWYIDREIQLVEKELGP